MTNYIRIYDEVVPQEQCDYFITLIEKSRKKAGRIFNKNGELEVNSNVKFSEDICFSTYYPSEIPYLLKVFTDQITIYEQDLGVVVPIENCEYINGRVYRKNIGYFKAHIDVKSKHTLARCLSIILYLNTITEGGHLFFPYQNYSIQPKQGRLLIFPSYWMYKHEANISYSNDRYIIRTFFNLL